LPRGPTPHVVYGLSSDVEGQWLMGVQSLDEPMMGGIAGSIHNPVQGQEFSHPQSLNRFRLQGQLNTHSLLFRPTEYHRAAA